MNTHAAKTVRWSVMWLGKNGFIVEKDFENDIMSAVATYHKLQEAGKKWVTLRSKNVGFAPPAYITEHEEESWVIVKRGRKRYKRKVVTVMNLMRENNLQGLFWCPYCHVLRKFTRAEDEQNLMCPVCEVTTRDFHVRNHNPNAIVVSESNRRVRSQNGKPVRKRRGRS